MTDRQYGLPSNFEPCADPLPPCDEECVCRPTMLALTMKPVVDAAMAWWWKSPARDDEEKELANAVWDYRMKQGMEDA